MSGVVLTEDISAVSGCFLKEHLHRSVYQLWVDSWDSASYSLRFSNILWLNYLYLALLYL